MIKIQSRRKAKSKMANPEHSAKLKEGVEPWNKRRKNNLEIKCDLTETGN